ncbi:calcium/cation antiporter family protein [Candidatus Nitrososphaera gargensis Ga9.2]|uniref:Calcium/cation antiporter family protein n=2 Tax=Candidatus Nitrososphaera gargensis TaxID=497727 RepID=K0IFA5_NITGG|nr:calcium/cation antiporter family protein [Candidatus Nitrososphaera gargensis Ga9.2]
MLLWLAELTGASFLLSYGAEHLSKKYGAKFVGRTLLSVATTLPEIAIVIYAAADGLYGTAIGAGLGSNLLMMTLGLSIMLLIATTRLSKAPLKGVDVTTFKLDKIFLLATAVISAVLFIDGYNFIDGFIFAGMFGAYLIMALMEMKAESKAKKEVVEAGNPGHKVVKVDGGLPGKGPNREMTKAMLAFVAGTAGIFFGASPFIESLEGFSLEVGVSVIILAVIISPIAGEMPEKISMMLLARKGAAGASIAVANVLGSKILNNTLLLAVAVFGAMYHGGFYANIALNPILEYQMILVTVVTIGALIMMFKKEIGLKVGIILAVMYIVSLFIQFLLPQDLTLH